MVLACAACVGPSASGDQPGGEPVRVTNAGQPYQMSDGAAARRAADAECGPGGVRSSIYDRYDRATAAWVYPGGCA
ncbi:MAG: hypothetical protein NTW20_01425 [Rhodobacterales bacterium]|nr:hypothetical protein [Rhodobacterales bacterium]